MPIDLNISSSSPSNVELTDEDSEDDEAFFNPDETRTINRSRLQRRGAFRKTPNSEPRITRAMLTPQTPSAVQIDRVQNLDQALGNNRPIHPDLVSLGPEVQNFERVLPLTRETSRRPRTKVDYKKLHLYGKEP